MASKKIKGITIEIGGDTSKFQESLNKATSKSVELSRELKSVDKLLKFNPQSTELLNQKQQILKESIEATSEKLKILEQAQVEVEKQFKDGKIDGGTYREFQREIELTRNHLERLQKSADSMSEIGKSAKDSSDDVKKLNDKLDDTADKIENADKKADEFSGGSLSNVIGIGKKAALAVGAVAAAGTTAFLSSAEASREYRTELSKVVTIAEDVGVSADFIKKKWQSVSSVLGDEGASAEGLNNIMAAGFIAEEKIDEITTYFEGAAIKWKDTLKFEGLADGLQETLATGSAVGPFAELLERSGIVLEDFDKGLQGCTTSADKQNYVLDKLSKLGLSKVSEKYREANKALIEGKEESYKYQEAIAEIGEIAEPVMNRIKSAGTSAIKTLASTMKSEEMQESLDKIGGSAENILENSVTVTEKAVPLLADGLDFVTEHAAETAVAVGGAALAINSLKIARTTITEAKALGQGFQALAAGGGAAVGATGLLAATFASLGGVTAAWALAAAFSKDRNADELEYLETIQDENKEIQSSYQAYKELSNARQEQAEAEIAEIDYIKRLNDELSTLVDANGKVKEGYEDRVEFIASQLSEATGLEIKLTDGVIKNYRELQGAIQETLNMQRAEIILNAEKEAYTEALENKTQTTTNINKLQGEQTSIKGKISANAAEQARIQSEVDWYEHINDLDAAMDAENRLQESIQRGNIYAQEYETISDSIATEKELLQGYLTDIAKYENDYAKVASGNADEIEEVNNRISESYTVNGEKIELTLKQRYDNAKEEYDSLLELSKEKDSEITDEQLKSAKNLVETLEKELEASKSGVKETASGIGKSIVEGIGRGIDEGVPTAVASMENAINKTFVKGKVTAEIESPSKRARREIGRFLPLGIAQGIEEETPSLVKAFENSIDSLFDVDRRERMSRAVSDVSLVTASLLSGFDAPIESKARVNSPSEERLSSLESSYSGLSDKLDLIAERLKMGVYLDGKILVGQLISGVDEGLGAMM